MVATVPSTEFVPPATGPSPTAARDAELVRRFNAGEAQAFVEIFHHYRGPLLSVAFATLRNHADAEEITQDAFIRAHRGLANFRGEASLSSWLHRIVFNLSCNRYWYYYRRRRHQMRSFDCSCSDRTTISYADVVACPTPDPARVETHREFSASIAACMRELGLQQREILTLRTVREYSYDEISRALGITVGTVKSRIARARRQLHALLVESYGGDLSSTSCLWFEPARPSDSYHRSGL